MRGVPGHRTAAKPAQSSSERLTWPTSVVCDNRVDGNIEIPSGGTPQDVPIFHMAATVHSKKHEPLYVLQEAEQLKNGMMECEPTEL